jgi:8-oxo-dGTP pyrophosphatase MutT (NUDIX family)
MLRLAYFAYRIYLFIFRPVTYGVRALLVKDSRVLLIRHTVETAAHREVREETGAEVGAIKLVGVYSNLESYSSGHNILFACEDFVITGKPDHEIAEARFFALDELPADMFPGHRRKVEGYLGGEIQSNVGAW